jgi:hypothetical protein
MILISKHIIRLLNVPKQLPSIEAKGTLTLILIFHKRHQCFIPTYTTFQGIVCFELMSLSRGRTQKFGAMGAYVYLIMVSNTSKKVINIFKENVNTFLENPY